MRALFFTFSVAVFIADRHVQGKKWEPMDGRRNLTRLIREKGGEERNPSLLQTRLHFLASPHSLLSSSSSSPHPIISFLPLCAFKR